MFMFIFLVGIVFVVLGSIFVLDIFWIMGMLVNIIDVMVYYVCILFVVIFVLFLYFVYMMFMCGIGDFKMFFYFLVVSMVLNIIFFLILIFGWIGVLKFGVYGVVYVMVFLIVLMFIIMIIYLCKKNYLLKFDLFILLKMDGMFLKLFMCLGILVSINMILVFFFEIVVIMFVNGFGLDVIVVYGVVN